ncbi:unnamed protein product [Didymodactylos carnosus]|uniref:Cytochrome P450 n=1 Tax=Didymodactylos carnosus TaxID=1234261 RepID=A0A815Q658_9BILA|nr:unnamed protein product [Didymodactylos carnosus]CAF1458624.1 unnamed protein product [Didymodactylos carnosus]CAF3645549.1 unnamed protein product [Didymodactylos carnosus]CAF4329623.1 unnamed protein product [Didymodactylos carnosus]
MRQWAWLFPNRLILADINAAHYILVKKESDFSKGHLDDGSPLTGSMLNNPDSKSESKGVLSYYLSSNQIKSTYIPLICECTDHLIRRWKTHLMSSKNNNFVKIDLSEYSLRLALDIVGETLLGGTFGACASYNSDREGDKLTKCMLKLTLQIFTQQHLTEKIISEAHSSDEALFIDELVQKRWDMLHKEQSPRHQLTIDDTKLLLFAGSETTATTLSLTLLTLAVYQDMQCKLRKELQGLTMENALKNNYLESFLREILRYWTIAPFIKRISTTSSKCPTVNSEKSVYIPRGSEIDILTWSIHHSQAYYKDPYTFSLFRTSKQQSKGKCPYLPFSIGARMCPGMQFALTELKIIVALLLEQFEFSIQKSKKKLMSLEQEFLIDWRHSVLHKHLGLIITNKLD